MKRRFELLILLGMAAVLATLFRPSPEPEPKFCPLPAKPAVAPAPVVVDGFSVQLKRLDDKDLAKARFRLELRNHTQQSRKVPNSFCLSTPWSQAVKLRIQGPRDSWELIPSFAQRDLHEHGTNQLNIGPEARLTWDFELSKLSRVSGSEEVLIQQIYRGTAGQLRIQVEMQSGEQTVLSNLLVVAQVQPLATRIKSGQKRVDQKIRFWKGLLKPATRS